jgi:hypothetical protein
LKKLWPFRVERVNNSKKTPPNDIKTSSQTPTKFHACCFVVIKIQR